MAKNIHDYFADWESHVFGYGYGTGEEYTVSSLWHFFQGCFEGPNFRSYDYKNLEKGLTPTVAWLLINTLCHADIIEYGRSPRSGWLTEKGVRLRDYMLSRDVEHHLLNLGTRTDNWCHPNACNCGERGYEKGRVCQNPFWLDKVQA